MLKLLKKLNKKNKFVSYVTGEVIPIEDVKDNVFSKKLLGEGTAIEPKDGIIVAPCDGTITMVMEESKHAVGIIMENGMELFLHIGLDTVTLEGEGFEIFTSVGQKVNKGDKLICFDYDLLEKKGFIKTCVLVITNHQDYPDIEFYTGMDAVRGETVILKY